MGRLGGNCTVKMATETVTHTKGNAKGDSVDVSPVYISIPTFSNLDDHRDFLLEQMAGAFRVFARLGYCVGTAGHISVRDPGNRNHFWLNPLGRHFGTLKKSDMVLVDHNGDIIGGSRLPVNKAGFMIHSAIHAARPDVNAACHTHSPNGTAYSAFGKHFDMLNQDMCQLYNNHAVYSDFGGVVLRESEGKNIASALGSNAVAILQNHGLLTVGTTVNEAAALFNIAERACFSQLQADASRFSPTLVSQESAKYTKDAQFYPEFLYYEFLPNLEYEEYCDPSFKN